MAAPTKSSNKAARLLHRPRKPLTADKQARGAKPEATPYKLNAGRGLSLHVMPNGGKWWRFRYRHAGKEKMLSLGTYPDVSLQRAREKRDEARRLVADSIDPSAKRKAERTALADTFEAVALEWFAAGCPGRARKGKKKRAQAGTVEYIGKRLVRYVYPFLGSTPVTAIDAVMLTDTLKRIEAEGRYEMAHRVANYCDRILLFAKLTGRISSNPAEGITGALYAADVRHHAAVVDPAPVGELLRRIDAYQGQPSVVAALKLMPYVFVRSRELRGARWEEIDLFNGICHTIDSVDICL